MVSPIRVLDLRDSGWVDGPGRTVLDVASAINRRRCEIIVAGFVDRHDSGSEYIEEARRRNLSVEVIREKAAFDMGVIRQILDIVERNSIDAIHTHDFRSNVIGLYCARRLRLPVLTTCHGWIANDTRGKIYTTMDRFLLRYFDRIIVVSNAMKDQLVSSGMPESNISVVQNALVIGSFTPSPDNKTFREELGLNGGTRLIANIGRLSAEKGQKLFILAARELVKSFDDVHFVVIGSGEDEGVLRRLVESNDLGKYVSFVGYRKDMVSVYDSTDLVVQSSSTEGMPNVILEALLMETPVVATDVGGTREVLNDGEFGTLVESGSLRALTDSIAEFLREPSSHRDIARRGAADIKLRFNNETRVEKMTKIYEGLLTPKAAQCS